jgi:hypothetical protein
MPMVVRVWTHEWEWNTFASIVCEVHFCGRGGESMEYGQMNGSGTLFHPLFVMPIFMSFVNKCPHLFHPISILSSSALSNFLEPKG